MAVEKYLGLQIKVERQPEMDVVYCTGRIVIDTWAQFSHAVRELIAEGKPIHIDAEHCGFLGATLRQAAGRCLTASKRTG